MDPQLDSSIQLKVRGLLNMECDFHHTPYMKIIFGDWNPLRQEHHAASKQPEKYSKMTPEVLEACTTWLRIALGLVKDRSPGTHKEATCK